MQSLLFDNSDDVQIVLDEDGPFAEYLRNTAQRVDNVRFEKYEDALNELSRKQRSVSPFDYEHDATMRKAVDEIQRDILDNEYKRCLLLMYIALPSFIQPLTKYQFTINDVICDFSYSAERDAIHNIYSDLYSHFYDNTNNDNLSDAKQSLFSTTLIICSRYVLFCVFILHATIAILSLLHYKRDILIIALIAMEIINTIFVMIDIYEHFEWLCFLNTIYPLIHYLSQYQTLIDKSFKILNNVTAITHGYALHHQFIPSHKIEQKNASLNSTNVHLKHLRLEMRYHLMDINVVLHKMTSLVAYNNSTTKHVQTHNMQDVSEKDIMLKDLLLYYRYFRIHKKILFTQLYRITSAMIYCNKLCKSIRSIWMQGFIWIKTRYSSSQYPLHHFINYIKSPFSVHQLHSFQRFQSLNACLLQLSTRLQGANMSLFAALRLSKTSKHLDRFSTTKIMKQKKQNLSNITAQIEDNDADKQRFNDIYNHLYRIQNRMDEMSALIYLMHEQCVEYPQNILINKENEIESKYKDDIDIDDEIEQHKALELMRDIMLGLNRTFNEWKFIVSNINPNSKLLQKYKNLGFDGWKSGNVYKYRHKLENVIEDDTYRDIDEKDDEAFKQQRDNLMSGLFAKLNKQRAKMSITEDGEELYEPTEEAKKYMIAADDNVVNDDLLNASMAKPGSSISVVDKYQMVDELKNVLANRKKAAIERFKMNNATKKEQKECSDVMQKENDNETETINAEKEANITQNRKQMVMNIRNAYPQEQVIETYGVDSSDLDDDEDVVSEEHEKQFLNELNRLGLNSGALMTRYNTEIQSFGYNTKEDGNTMSLFAVLQAQNKSQREDIEMDVKNEDDDHKEQKQIDDDCDQNTSELQKDLQERRSDDEGGTLADELSGLIQ